MIKFFAMFCRIAMKERMLLKGVRSGFAFCAKFHSHQTAKLAYISYPIDARAFEKKPPLVIIHGLFGHKGNWASVAKQLQHKLHLRVIVADLRNHGDSPHMNSMSYADMAADVEHMLANEWAPELNKCYLLAHSLGGKVGSYLALEKPHLIDKLILEDIVPKTYLIDRYSTDLSSFVKTMLSCSLIGETLSEVRRQVDEQLKPVVEFLLTNLVEKEGNVVWRMNLKAIEQFIPSLFKFPHLVSKTYNGPTLVLWGEKTQHLNPQEDGPYLKTLFPKVKLQMIAGSGHWIHAQKPNEFIHAVVKFLTADES